VLDFFDYQRPDNQAQDLIYQINQYLSEILIVTLGSGKPSSSAVGNIFGTRAPVSAKLRHGLSPNGFRSPSIPFAATAFLPTCRTTSLARPPSLRRMSKKVKLFFYGELTDWYLLFVLIRHGEGGSTSLHAGLERLGEEAGEPTGPLGPTP